LQAPQAVDQKLWPSLEAAVPIFRELLSDLRQAEVQLVSQLEGIRNAISSLEMGSAVSPSIPHREPGRQAKTNGGNPVRKRQRMSAAARKAVSLRMKKYWAARRRADAKAK
jgi:hypothetical protein